MSDESQDHNARIMLSAVRQMDELARRFRRKLRDAAVELAQDCQTAPIGPDAVLRAVPLACRGLLSEAAASSEGENGPHGERCEAA